MSLTMYNTPILSQIVILGSRMCLSLAGWKLQGNPPEVRKYVIIGAPHTSNWDFPLALAIAFVYRFEMNWMGKESLFKGWRRPFMKWLGGIAVDRSSANNVVSQTIELFNKNKCLIVTITPEGTRSKVKKWKTGFYFIAVGAQIPIALGFLDYKRKIGGFLPTFYPTGDKEKDIAEIRGCYAGVSGKYSTKFTVE
jgi:1-acyl-sn-glycerol-3-phosphate acyltransferase